MQKKLDVFLDSLPKSSIRGITDDSRKVQKDFLFVAIKGLTSDGHKFITQAIQNGAKIVIGENDLSNEIPKGIIYFRVDDSRQALSLIAAWFYGKPSKKMKMIGVTGTDGKTTTATLIYWILKTAGKKVGLISTVSAKIGNKDYDTGFHVTNPESIELQKFLAQMVKSDLKYCVLEVTSHGLDQGRVYGISFDISVLTNITHEHLDYHKTFNNYIKAKAKLLNTSKVSVINKQYLQKIDKYLKNTKKITFQKSTLIGEIKKTVEARFPEEYNVLNSTGAILVSKKLGVDKPDIIRAIKTFPGVSGRMTEIKNEKGLRVIIDFAHTPNALKNVLEVLKSQKLANNKLICVFGCAGERDTKKRPMMAEISTTIADISIFTAEDPRHEKVKDIISQMAKGVVNKKAKVYKVEDRKKAIKFAIEEVAQNGDIVIVCGKGHEKSMNFNGLERKWSDQEVANKLLNGNI